MVKERIMSDAYRAVRNNEKGEKAVKRGDKRNVLTHKPSSYGVAMKWLLNVRGVTFAQFGKRYNGTTGQNINHLLNRANKDNFDEENLRKMCFAIGVDFGYFMALSEEIEKIMGSES